MPASLRWLCAILFAASAWNAAAQNYPSQPIRLIAPFPPGGGPAKEIVEKFQAQAFDSFITTPGQAGRYIAEEAKRLSRVIKKTKGITAD